MLSSQFKKLILLTFKLAHKSSIMKEAKNSSIKFPAFISFSFFSTNFFPELHLVNKAFKSLKAKKFAKVSRYKKRISVLFKIKD